MSFQKTKIDSNLGWEVHEHLKKLGLETPMKMDKVTSDVKEKIEKIEKHMKEVCTILGLDLDDDSLIETPKRVAKMMVLENYWGLNPDNFPKSTTILNKFNNDVVNVKKIKVMSTCEHHLVTIDGFATVAYLPKDKVIGLSKINRVVEYFSRRPQVQERLTEQIAETLKFLLETEDVAVMINAKHYCVISRGVEDQNSYTTTTHVSGIFKDSGPARNEFMMVALKEGL